MTRNNRFPVPRLPIVFAASIALAACSGSVVPSAPARPGSKPYTSPILTGPGLEGVVGAGESDLVRQFGPPRLNVVEPYGRKLQFSGDPCILDAYLYPDNRGQERVTYVDARSHNGAEVDRASCISALRSAR